MTHIEYEQAFQKIMEAQRFSLQTQKNYGSIFRHFLYTCERVGVAPALAPDTIVLDFVLGVKSNSAVRQRHGVIRNFFNWILHDKNRMKYIPYPPKEERVVNYFTLHELECLLGSIDNPKQRAVVFTQYCCGLRVSEVVKIRRKDFIKKYDIRSKGFVFDLRIIGKGNKERMIPVPDYCLKAIREYWDGVKPEDRHEEYLFRGQFGGHYSVGSVQIVVREALKKIGYTKKASTHTLRHSKATHLHHAGADIQDIADLLGHKNVETARIYSHSDTSKLRVSFTKAEKFMEEELLAQKEDQRRMAAG